MQQSDDTIKVHFEFRSYQWCDAKKKKWCDAHMRMESEQPKIFYDDMEAT